MNTSIGVSNTAASVIAYRTTVFPSFWLSEYAHSIDWSVQSAVEVAATHLHLTDYSFIDAIALASVISPNLDERRVLTGLDDPREIAVRLGQRFAVVALTVAATGGRPLPATRSTA